MSRLYDCQLLVALIPGGLWMALLSTLNFTNIRIRQHYLPGSQSGSDGLWHILHAKSAVACVILLPLHAWYCCLLHAWYCCCVACVILLYFACVILLLLHAWYCCMRVDLHACWFACVLVCMRVICMRVILHACYLHACWFACVLICMRVIFACVLFACVLICMRADLHACYLHVCYLHACWFACVLTCMRVTLHACYCMRVDLHACPLHACWFACVLVVGVRFCACVILLLLHAWYCYHCMCILAAAAAYLGVLMLQVSIFLTLLVLYCGKWYVAGLRLDSLQETKFPVMCNHYAIQCLPPPSPLSDLALTRNYLF